MGVKKKKNLPLVILNETKKKKWQKENCGGVRPEPSSLPVPITQIAFPWRSKVRPFHPALLSAPPHYQIICSSHPPHIFTAPRCGRLAGRRLSDLFIKAGRRDQLRSCRTSLSSEWAGFESGPVKFVAAHTKFLVFNVTSSYKLELNYLGKDGPIVCFSHVTISKILILIFTGRQVQVQ